MNKTFTKIVNYLEYLLFIGATALVIIFQFIPNAYYVIVAIGMYVAGFFTIAAMSVAETAQIFAISKKVSAEDSALISSGKVEQIKSKKEKVLKILLTIMWLVLFAFSLVVLILYLKKI